MELRRVLAPLAMSYLIVQGCGIESPLAFLTSAVTGQPQDGGEAPREGGAVFRGLAQTGLWMQPPQQKNEEPHLFCCADGPTEPFPRTQQTSPESLRTRLGSPCSPITRSSSQPRRFSFVLSLRGWLGRLLPLGHTQTSQG